MAERDGTDQPASKGKDQPEVPVVPKETAAAPADAGTPKDATPAAGGEPAAPVAPAASSFTNTALVNSVGVTPAAAPPPAADVTKNAGPATVEVKDTTPAAPEAAAPAAPAAPEAAAPVVAANEAPKVDRSRSVEVFNLGVWRDAENVGGNVNTRIQTQNMTAEQIESSMKTLKEIGFTPLLRDSQSLGQVITLVGEKDFLDMSIMRHDLIRAAPWAQADASSSINTENLNPAAVSALTSALKSENLMPSVADGKISVEGDKMERLLDILAGRDVPAEVNPFTPVAAAPAAPAAPAAQAEEGAKATAPAAPAAPAAEDTEASKDKPVAQPVILDEEDTPEAREKRKQAEAAANAATNQGQGKPAIDTTPKNDDAAPAPEPQQQAQGKGIAAYQTAFRKNGFIDFMNNEWGTPDVDDEMKKAIGEKGKIRKNNKYGLDFVLNNGQKIEWHQNLGGSEFIGMTSRTKDFDLTTAHAVIATSKTRGWKTVHVHGDKDQKDMLWLEAMRQGLEVANHQPTMDSKYRAMWEKEAQERLDANLQGVSPAEHPLPRIPRDGVKFDGADEMQPPAQSGDTAKAGTPETGKPVESPAPAQPEAAAGAPAAPAAPAAPTAPTSAADSTFMKPAEEPSSNFAEFLARQRKAHEGDPDKLKSIQSLEDSASGKAGPTTIDPEIASAAAKEGITLPVKADASAQPAAVADEGAKVVDPKATVITPPAETADKPVAGKPAAPAADGAGKVDPKATVVAKKPAAPVHKM